MRKLQSFLSKVAEVLMDLKNQGVEYLQQIGEDHTITAEDEIEWEDGEATTEGPPVL